MPSPTVRPTIRLVTVWSGPLPRYLPLFLGTAASNPTVEFVFVADAPPPGDLPSNVRWVERSFAALRRSLEERLGCDLSEATPFKLCDLRPAYGVGFADLLAGCDFGGSIDCDTVLGDLRSFATDERLDEHDVLSFKGNGFVHGPLTMWRNTGTVNRLYERTDWRQVFEVADYLGFDETCKRWDSEAGVLPVAVRVERGQVPSISDVVHEAAADGIVAVYDGRHIVETKPRRQVPHLALLWNRGSLVDAVNGQSVAFFHIHWAKSDAERGDPVYELPAWGWDELPPRFGITRRRIGRVDTAFAADWARAATKALGGRVKAVARRWSAPVRGDSTAAPGSSSPSTASGDGDPGMRADGVGSLRRRP